ncbi:MAG TPA: PIN domain-containing protein [Nocardioidaceae bacterium]|nr:PIN domain-containing protein [Nocardioidaceae bacterium]
MGSGAAQVTVKGLELDAGALIGLDRGDEQVRALLREALAGGLAIHVVAGVVAQMWRGGPRQARLASFLDSAEVRVMPMDSLVARAVGQLCGRAGARDVVDVHVALDARTRGFTVVTSDPRDITKVDPSIRIIAV